MIPTGLKAERRAPDTQGGPVTPESAGDPGAWNTQGAFITPEKKYQAAKVMSASPLELILVMYEQFFALIPDIKASIGKKSQAAMEPDSERAHAIIEELINALDFDIEMSKDLGAIYFYVRDRILEANIRFDPAIWDHIEATMRPLYEGFSEAAKQLAPTAKPGALPSNNPSIVAGMTYGQGKLKEIVVNTKSGLQV
ncbi:MAG: flagellar export chaperone FliS [Clostridiales bacterium]|nr:flagellar export chaperone FliS [Clostridiales bacterium]